MAANDLSMHHSKTAAQSHYRETIGLKQSAGAIIFYRSASLSAYKTDILSWPDAVENEEELNEDAAERQNSTHQNSGNGTDVHGLLRDLTRDLIGAHWMLNCLKTNITSR